MSGFGKNPITLRFHHRGQTNSWGEPFASVADAIEWIARLPHLEVEKIVTPTGIHDEAWCRTTIAALRAQTPLKEQIEQWTDSKKAALKAHEAQEAMEATPGYGTFS